ncbi:MAG TPA: MFS transporter [Streptosporangiaceae bacterium]|jgi:EmrB/QacA subfamily drug resistance transporter
MLGRQSRAGQADPEDARLASYRRVAIWVISVGQLMFILDTTIVNVALPHIQSALHFSGNSLEWMVSAYSLCYGGLLLLGGRAGDILGRRRVFVAGTIVFTAASLLAGFAITQWWLLAARAAQGIGSAFASPSALSLVATTFPGDKERTRALGVYTAIATGGGAIGVLAGGLLTTYVTWRSVFFVNVPIGLAIIALVPRVLAESERHPRRFDVLGAVTGTGAITLFVYALISGATGSDGASHWADPNVLASLVTGGLLLVAFLVTEVRTDSPLVPLRLLTQRARSAANLIVVCIGTAMFGVFFFLTLFLQRVWGYSPLHTSILYIPPALLLTVGGPVASRIVPKTGRRLLVCVGLAIAGIGMLGMSTIGQHASSEPVLLAWTYFGYAGLGLTGVPLIAAALDRVPPSDSGVASGVYSTSRQLGGATGLAVLGTVAWSVVASNIARVNSHWSYGDPHTPTAVLRQALTAGADRAFLTAAIVIFAAFVIASLTITGGRGSPASPGPSGQSHQQRPGRS